LAWATRIRVIGQVDKGRRERKKGRWVIQGFLEKVFHVMDFPQKKWSTNEGMENIDRRVVVHFKPSLVDLIWQQITFVEPRRGDNALG